uniref:Uncharacterized protein n=1 Tax=Steinernema glaseri TaxID=37863 RepID=A0A1I7ZGH8_9BILA
MHRRSPFEGAKVQQGHSTRNTSFLFGYVTFMYRTWMQPNVNTEKKGRHRNRDNETSIAKCRMRKSDHAGCDSLTYY